MNALTQARAKAEPTLLNELNCSHPNKIIEATIQFSPDRVEEEIMPTPLRADFSSDEDWYHACALTRINKFEFVIKVLFNQLVEDKLNPRPCSKRNMLSISGTSVQILSVLTLEIVTYGIRTADLEGDEENNIESKAPQTEHIQLTEEEFRMLRKLSAEKRLRDDEIIKFAWKLLEDCDAIRKQGNQPVIYEVNKGEMKVIDEPNRKGFFRFEVEAGFPDIAVVGSHWVQEMFCLPELMKRLQTLQSTFGLQSIQQVTKLALHRYFHFHEASKSGYQFGNAREG